MIDDLAGSIFSLKNDKDFSVTALEFFRFQAEKNPVYHSFIMSLGKDPDHITDIHQIPFLPVGFFKSQKVIAEGVSYEKVFESSRTTGSVPSRHYVHSLEIYKQSFLKSFIHFYGDPSLYFIAALLPSYNERQNSSLVYMADILVGKSLNRNNGFYSGDTERLINDLQKAKEAGQKRILLGVSFALLDLATNSGPDLAGTIIMETGGMKGRRKEITREELHKILKEGLNVTSIHSEYGMTELLSQAYSKGEGVFFSPPWMRILIRDPYDPLSLTEGLGITGGINIIDLANFWSCSFISTGDFGRLREDGGFEISGRLDNSDIRGCNLLVD